MRSLRKEDNAKCWQKVGSKPPCLLQVRREIGTDILEIWPAFFPQIKYFIPAVSLLSKHAGAVLPQNKERLCMRA